MTAEGPSDPFAQFDGVRTVPALLSVTARTLVDVSGAAACTISRAIGDLLVDLVDYSAHGPVQVGHGYLISDYPATREVLETLRPSAVFVGDDAADEREAALLRQLGFDSLLMLPLMQGDAAWGLVELYDRARNGFRDADVAAATAIVTRASDVLSRLAG